MTETAKRSQDGWGVSGDWREVEGAWVLRPRNSRPTSVVHFIGAVPLFSCYLPMAQSFGPVISQLISSPTVRFEMAMKQFETLSPPIMKQVLPLVEQLPPLYMVEGHFIPKPEETRRLLLSSESAISSLLDMSVRSLPGDHLQVIPDVPPGMADAVNRGSELLVNLTVGTPWETVAREVNSTLGVDIKSQISKDVDLASWMTSTMGSMLLKP
ncbi:hypothetical protein IFM89_024566 [Coptis chinensis]|uniref:Uncharacterized protein n=1 Tax=Coptis chinensis TaxID=261450 RepID=A0A835I4Y4_9MAGN|nr:hypothetical protein IFM89_024566 [Coptis chinensis]